MTTASPCSRPHRPGGPDDLYRTPPPWDLGRPQGVFRALADVGAIQGRVLDAVCGTGEHVLMCAGLGLDATGIDLASAALRRAEEKARERGRTARFLHQDARQVAELGESFDTILDCGLFHSFDADERVAYVHGLRAVLTPGGRCFLLCFSDRQPAGNWPWVHRVTKADIAGTFADGWQVDSIEPATIEITTDPDGIRAWFAACTRS